MSTKQNSYSKNSDAARLLTRLEIAYSLLVVEGLYVLSMCVLNIVTDKNLVPFIIFGTVSILLFHLHTTTHERFKTLLYTTIGVVLGTLCNLVTISDPGFESRVVTWDERFNALATFYSKVVPIALICYLVLSFVAYSISTSKKGKK